MIRTPNGSFKSIWFGNFYRPAFDDKEFVRNTLIALKDMGFTSILLDSKAWEDFQLRYEGGDPSNYVEMQEYMQKTAREIGLSYEFLSLYLNGDNLYPNIRFSPPIYGESVCLKDGSDGKHYLYWSEKAKSSMVNHVKGLIRLYGDGVTTIEGENISGKPMVSMWDPIVAPSFDSDGNDRYISYLKGIYSNIDELNLAYGTSYSDFDELDIKELWLEGTPKNEEEKHIRYDNRRWQRDELILYFKEMKKLLTEVDSNLLLVPNLTQWGYFLTLDGVRVAGAMLSDLWDTANRGIDIYRLSEYVDITHFISVPVTPSADAEPYVTSYHHSMMRVMNRNRDFLGGLYFGRYLYNDIYRTLTPCELIGSIAASGAGGYYSYGVCGLDDGGLMHRMNSYFREDLKRANRWLDTVLPLTGKRLNSEAAVLFPSAMALAEDYSQNSENRRLDSLGWYKLLLDYGISTDITDLSDFSLNYEAYSILILPEDDMYTFERDKSAEEVLRKFVNKGGVVIHSPGSQVANCTFKIDCEDTEPSPVIFSEKALITTTMYKAFSAGDVIARYSVNQKAAAVRSSYGSGLIISLGFDYGLSYISKEIPHVPICEKNNELYPISILKECPLKTYFEEALEREIKYECDIEKAFFEKGFILVNHRSYPYTISDDDRIYGPYDNLKTIQPHCCAFIEARGGKK